MVTTTTEDASSAIVLDDARVTLKQQENGYYQLTVNGVDISNSALSVTIIAGVTPRAYVTLELKGSVDVELLHAEVREAEPDGDEPAIDPEIHERVKARQVYRG